MIPQTVKQWEEQIRLAKLYQEDEGRLQRWKENSDFYDNKYPPDVVRVNLIFSIGRGLVPQLYFKAPTILNIPRKPGLAQSAKILEAVDNWLIPHIGLKPQIKLGILDAFRTNIAVFKFGYHSIGSEFPTQQEEEDPVPESMREAMSSFLSILKTKVLPFERGQVDEAEDEDKEYQRLRRYSYHDWVRPDCPWMLRIAPEDYLVPHGGLDNWSIPWCAFRVLRPLDDVKKDPVYSNTRSLKANAKLEEVKTGAIVSPNLRNGVPKQDMVELWEIWDKRDGRVRVIVEGHEKYLRNDEHRLDIDGLPSEVLQFNPNGRDFWGVSDVDQIKDQIREYNETRTVELMHKKTAMTKFVFDETKFDDAEIQKFTKGQLAAIKCKDAPESAIKQIQQNMSGDLYKMSNIVRQDIFEITGWNRNQLGEFESDRRTATEASIVQSALQLRSDERRDQVADLIASAFQRKIHPMLFDFWTEEREIEVSGLGGWVTYTGPQIRGDYGVQVVADSVVPLSRQLRQRVLTEAFKVLNGDPYIDQYRLRQAAVAAFDDVLPPDLVLPPQQAQQNMMQQALQAQVGQPQPQRPQQTPNPMQQALKGVA